MFRITRAILASAGTASLLLATGVPSVAATTSGSDSRVIASHSVFAPNSPFYQKLPANSPVASDSATLVSSLNQQAHQYYGTATEANVSVNTQKFAPALYVAYRTDPVFNITGWNCQNKQAGWNTEFNRIMQGVHVPADMLPDPSTDGAVSIYNPDTNDVVELWQARKVNGQWQACWGGRITNADESIGVHANGYGASASGIALWAGTIRASEFLKGKIDHVISLGIPRTKKASISWPANRSDGGTVGTELSIGQMLRLPASLELDAMNLSPVREDDREGSAGVRHHRHRHLRFGDVHRRELDRAEAPTPTRDLPQPVVEPGDERRSGVRRDPLPAGQARGAAAQLQGADRGDESSPGPTRPTPRRSWRPSRSRTGASATPRPRRTTPAAPKGPGRSSAPRRVVPGAIAGNTALRTLGTSSSAVYRTAVTLPPRNFSVQVWFNTTTNRREARRTREHDDRTGYFL